MRKKIIIIFIGLPLLFLLYATITLVPERGGGIASSYGFSYPLVIAHRGASYHAPEATKAAYKIALAMKPEYIEADLQLTKDGIPVCLHDKDLKRTTNVEEVFPERQNEGPSAFTLAELKRLNAGSWFNEKYPERARKSFKDEKILSLKELLDLLKDSKSETGLYLETKLAKNSPGIEEKVYELLNDYKLLRPHSFEKNPRLVFQSFEPESIMKLRKLAPHIPGTLLSVSKGFSSKDRQEFLSLAKKNADGIGILFTAGLPGMFRGAHQKGLFVHVYTIDYSFFSMLLIKFGADGIFTNRPDDLLNRLGRAKFEDINSLIEKTGY